MRSVKTILALGIVISGMLTSFADAALLFAINGQEGSLGTLFTLTNGSPTVTFTVGVRRDDADSGGSHLDTFAIRLRSSNASVAVFSNVTLSGSPINTGATGVSGAVATAAGTYPVRQNFAFASPGTYATLASFTLQGLTTGSTNVTIEEATIDNVSGGPIDIIAGAASGGTPVGLDRTGFSGPGSAIGLASTQFGLSSTIIVAVPEPGSFLLASAGLGLAGVVRARRRAKA